MRRISAGQYIRQRLGVLLGSGVACIGLGLLPTYWLFWKAPLAPEQATARRYLTWLLAFFVWWGFLTGHVLNNIKGLLP